MPWAARFQARYAQTNRGLSPTPSIRIPVADRVGDTDPQRIVVPTNQVLSPLGQQVAYSGRPVDIALSPNGRWLAVLDRALVLLIDPASGKVVSRASHKGGSYAGLCFSPDSKRLLASSIRGTIGVFEVEDDGELETKTPIELNSVTNKEDDRILPVGLAMAANGKSLWAVLNLRNALAEIDWNAGKVLREIPVGNAPFGVVLVGNKAYVSNWAGRHPDAKSTVAPAGSGTPVRVDPKRFIANDGSVSVVDLTAGKELKQIVVGLHPSSILPRPTASTC